MPTELASHVPPAVLQAGLPASSITDLFAAIKVGTPDALTAVPGMTPQILAVVGSSLADGYAAAYAYVYYAAIAVGGVGLIGECFSQSCMIPANQNSQPASVSRTTTHISPAMFRDKSIAKEPLSKARTRIQDRTAPAITLRDFPRKKLKLHARSITILRCDTKSREFSKG